MGESELKGVYLCLNKKLWKEYQKMCLDLGESPSHRIRSFIDEELKKFTDSKKNFP